MNCGAALTANWYFLLSAMGFTFKEVGKGALHTEENHEASDGFGGVR